MRSFTTKHLNISEFRKKEFFFSLLVFSGSVFFVFLLNNDILLALALGLVFGALFYFAFKKIPEYKEKLEDEKREKELPFFLQQLAISLDLGLSFEKTLAEYSKGKGFLNGEIKSALKQAYLGKTIDRELFKIAEKSGNEDFKRAFMQLINIYDSGTRGETLKILSKEILEKQKMQSKEFNAKMSMLALMFISSSAIIPALFQSFMIVGSMVLDTGLNELHAILIPGIVFPALSAGILFLIYMKTPGFLK